MTMAIEKAGAFVAATGAVAAVPAAIDPDIARELATAWPVGVVLLAIVGSFLWAMVHLADNFRATLAAHDVAMAANVAECHRVQERTHDSLERTAEALGRTANALERAEHRLAVIEARS